MRPGTPQPTASGDFPAAGTTQFGEFERRAGQISLQGQEHFELAWTTAMLLLSLVVYYCFKQTALAVPIKPSRFSRPMQWLLIALPLVLGAIAAALLLRFLPWPEGFEDMWIFSVIFPAIPAAIACVALW